MKDPTAWIPIARETKWILCLKKIPTRLGTLNVQVCRHRNLWTAYHCRKGNQYAALFKDGTQHSITIHHLTASNGEQAYLPFPKGTEP